MEFENLIKLIDAVSSSNLTRFSYEENGVVLKMQTDKQQKIVTVNGGSTLAAGTVNAADTAFLAGNVVTSTLAGSSNVSAEAPAKESVSGNVVESPLVGTFYAAATPEDEPFVKVGDTVKKGQVLGIVEAMKLMNEIESDFDGVLKEILVSNEEVIEFGQPLFVIG